ncbi:MAG TPA: hypothetical protein VD833_12090 [Vicinamibacterales bacterium]|nr:hypothetical protein [Vicinamibacterales bacterium]
MTHHWLDSTHVTFGVLTAGVHNPRWKVETSVFNGRDPDEPRTDLDLGGFDSAAVRLSVLPTERLALQVSAARLREARTDFLQQTDRQVTRATASAVYHRPIGPAGIWATTLAIGVNDGREHVAGTVRDAASVAALLETSLTWKERNTVFGRVEIAEMPAHHLHAFEYSTEAFPVAKLQAGCVRYLRSLKGLVPGVGATASFSVLPPALAPRYSGRIAPGVGIFLTVRAGRHEM